MTIQNICHKFLDLINKNPNNSIPLESGIFYSFYQHKKYSLAEVQAFEIKKNLSLPYEYKVFLEILGACELYVDEYGLGIEFYELEKIESFMAEVFLDRINLFPKLVFIGSNLNNSDFIGFDLSKPENHNLTLYSIAEEEPEDWKFTQNPFISLEQFLEKLFDSDGENYYL